MFLESHSSIFNMHVTLSCVIRTMLLCLVCNSMELTQKLRAYAAERGLGTAEAAAEGMQRKAEEFREAGALYVPAEPRS